MTFEKSDKPSPARVSRSIGYPCCMLGDQGVAIFLWTLVMLHRRIMLGTDILESQLGFYVH